MKDYDYKKEDEVVIDHVKNDTVLGSYSNLRIIDREKEILSRELSDLSQQANLVHSKIQLLIAKREIINKKLWEELYSEFPSLQDYNRLRLQEKGPSLSVVAPAIQHQPPFLNFPFGP